MSKGELNLAVIRVEVKGCAMLPENSILCSDGLLVVLFSVGLFFMFRLLLVAVKEMTAKVR